MTETVWLVGLLNLLGVTAAVALTVPTLRQCMKDGDRWGMTAILLFGGPFAAFAQGVARLWRQRASGPRAALAGICLRVAEFGAFLGFSGAAVLLWVRACTAMEHTRLTDATLMAGREIVFLLTILGTSLAYWVALAAVGCAWLHHRSSYPCKDLAEWQSWAFTPPPDTGEASAVSNQGECADGADGQSEE